MSTPERLSCLRDDLLIFGRLHAVRHAESALDVKNIDPEEQIVPKVIRIRPTAL